MYKVSEEYKKSMKNPIRNRTFAKVYLGLINQEAQNSATVTDQSKYTGFSDFQTVFTKNDIGNVYATYEKDFFKCDGSLFFFLEIKQNGKRTELHRMNCFQEIF